ncbi:hypothetical protein C8N46_10578 [Kordia periserrulae]|uniref:Uncharacterized protein n=1 Tax=Kordia periserrulae TaxID=701523 RepID=A0A2T6BXW5_9FLAO|nr:hypothetical protein [Kordia periserrulae]PTX60922.1 hypothetical protein C8N46_10578 [Kordia periserrulae]
MRFIYYTNNIVLALTVLGYSFILPGMFMQFILGILQVLFFIVLLFNYNKFSERIQKHLQSYAIITGITLLVLFSNIGFEFLSDSTTWFLTTILIPMAIAGYFTYIIAELQKRVL